MLTRCPNCETTFRVTPEQLKARHGKVRCGECHEVFNALDTLIEAAPNVAPVSASVDPQPSEPQFEPESLPVTEEAAPVEEVGLVVEAETADALVVDATPGHGPEPDSESGPESKPEFEPEPEPEPPPEQEPPPPAEDPATEPVPADEWLPTPGAPKPRRRWPWMLGSAAAMLVLAFQVLMHFRSEIVVLQPDMAPTGASACEVLGCQMRLPRKVELMSIETSDLHPEAEGKLTLTATLKNRAPFAQEHAHLELTLTDTADKALVRRVLPPAEYLAAADRSAGLPPGKELPVELSIDAPGVPAAGYRLYLFYP